MLCRDLTENDIGKYFVTCSPNNVRIIKYVKKDMYFYMFDVVKRILVRPCHPKHQYNDITSDWTETPNDEIFPFDENWFADSKIVKKKMLSVYEFCVRKAKFEIFSRNFELEYYG